MTHKIIFTLIVLALTCHGFAQGVGTANGAFVTIGAGTHFVVTGSGKIINNSSSVITNDGTITIPGDFENNNSATIDNDGTINIAGDWTNSSSGVVFVNPDANGTTVFNGSSAQTITGGANSTAFENLTFNNSTAGAAINISTGNVTVTNVVNFTDGIVVTGANTIDIENNAAGAIGSFSNVAFVNGNIRRSINPVGSLTYEFPVGQGNASTDYYRVTVLSENLVLTGNIIDVSNKNIIEGVNPNETDAQMYSAALNAGGTPLWWIQSESLWNIVATRTGGTYGVRLYLENTYLDASYDNAFTPVKRASSSTDYADFGFGTSVGDVDIPTHGSAGRIYNAGAGYAERTNFTTFSQFGIVTSRSKWALPVELLSFVGNCENDKVELNWETASEINNDYFIVEQSTNGYSFYEIEQVTGSGSTSKLSNYSLQLDALTDPTVYRLSQVDYNGKTEVVGLVDVKPCIREASEINVSRTDKVTYHVSNFEINDMDVFVFNSVGQHIDVSIQTTDNGADIKFSALATGVYFIKVSTSKNIITKKIYIE